MMKQSFDAEREPMESSGTCQDNAKRMYPWKVISELIDISINELATSWLAYYLITYLAFKFRPRCTARTYNSSNAAGLGAL